MNDDSGAETITHLSLCAGYEGIGLGLKRVFPNLRGIAYVEREGFAVANLVAKMEEGRLDKAPIFTDVKTFPYRKFRGLVDILSGGFPCQPFSSAGKRDGVEDPRHLFPFIAEGIRQCRPKIVFLENVEGIISAKTHDSESVLQYVLRTLEDLDYCTTAGIFSASEVGAPHQRKRVFILGLENPNNNQTRDLNGKASRQTRREPSHQQTDGKGCSIWSKPTSSETLAHSSSKRQGKRREPKNIFKKDERQNEKLPPKPGGSSEKLADSLRSGLERARECDSKERRQNPFRQYRGDCEVWPSRPSETQKEWEEPRCVADSFNQRRQKRSIKQTTRDQCCCSSSKQSEQTEPELGGTNYGNSSRVDRLRLLGNGVVPATAEKAFRTLIDRLT